MIDVEIVCVGKLKQGFLSDGCAEYQKRISSYAKITVTELAETKLSGNGEAAIQKVVESESTAILEYIKNKKAATVALCIDGMRMSSEEVARYLETTAQRSSGIIFIIGASHGLSRTLTGRADMRLSMSDMTFPHQMARLMLLEQLYRAFNINANGKYHK